MPIDSSSCRMAASIPMSIKTDDPITRFLSRDREPDFFKGEDQDSIRHNGKWNSMKTDNRVGRVSNTGASLRIEDHDGSSASFDEQKPCHRKHMRQKFERYRSTLRRGKPPPRPCFVSSILFLLLAANSQAISFSGQLSLHPSVARVEADSIYSEGKDALYFDSSADLRLNTGWQSRHHLFTLQYQISGVSGDVYERSHATLQNVPLLGESGHTDTLKALHLTHTFSSTSDTHLQHRIDRLSYQCVADWAAFTLGRDVVTWGNGLVFNPLDLLNPFAPDDIERDYKAGDDLLLVDLYPASWNGNLNWQLLIVPHRDPSSRNLSAAHSSFGLKTHFFVDASEWDLLVAMHYDEPHIGIGSAHTLGGSVLRADLLLAFPETGSTRLSAVVNIDHSWTLAGHNTYGLLEYYFQSIGVSDAHAFYVSPRSDLLERLARGEVYTYGKHYLSGALQVELHPLLQAHISSIINLSDSSLLLQPYLQWEPAQNLQIALGARLLHGDNNTEFGPMHIPTFPPQKTLQSPNTFFAWLKWYF